MQEYYNILRRRHKCRVLPIAVFLRVGLDGVGIDTYVEKFDELEVVRFKYLYVGLPALNAEQYLTCDNVLGVGLTALMRIPANRRAWFRSEALRRILLESKENDYRKFLLSECVEAYLDLDQEQQSAFEQMMEMKEYKEIHTMMMTTYEKGIAEGEHRGQRKAVRVQIEHRFGPLSPEIQQTVDNLPPDKLSQLLVAVLDAASLDSLLHKINGNSNKSN